MTLSVLFRVSGFIDIQREEFPRFVVPIYRPATQGKADGHVYWPEVNENGEIFSFERLDRSLTSDYPVIPNFGRNDRLLYTSGSYKNYALLFDNGHVFDASGWENFCKGIVQDHAADIAKINPILGLEFAEVGGNEELCREFALMSAMKLGEIDYKLARRWGSDRHLSADLEYLISKCLDSWESGAHLEIPGEGKILNSIADVRVCLVGSRIAKVIRPALYSFDGMKMAVTVMSGGTLIDSNYWKNIDIAIIPTEKFLNGDVERLIEHSPHITAVASVEGEYTEFLRDGWGRYGACNIISTRTKTNLAELWTVARPIVLARKKREAHSPDSGS